MYIYPFVILKRVMFFKKYFILLLILYGFTPCSVKHSAFDVFSLEYNRTVNINKTSQNSYCSSTVVDQVVTKKQKVQQLLKSGIHYTIPIVSHKISNQWNGNSVSGRSPPLYILFRQLKIAPFFTGID